MIRTNKFLVQNLCPTLILGMYMNDEEKAEGRTARIPPKNFVHDTKLVRGRILQERANYDTNRHYEDLRALPQRIGSRRETIIPPQPL